MEEHEMRWVDKIARKVCDEAIGESDNDAERFIAGVLLGELEKMFVEHDARRGQCPESAWEGAELYRRLLTRVDDKDYPTVDLEEWTRQVAALNLPDRWSTGEIDASYEVVYGEVNGMSSESDDQALDRSRRQADANAQPMAMLTVEGPTGKEVIALGEEEFQALITQRMMFGVFNMSRRLPNEDDYDGVPDLTDAERRRMGLKPRQSRKLLTEEAGQPLTVDKCIGIGELRFREGFSEKPAVLRADLKANREGWATHFAIGNVARGMLIAGQFAKPTPMKVGNGFSFGMKIEVLKRRIVSGISGQALASASTEALGPSALPAPVLPASTEPEPNR